MKDEKLMKLSLVLAVAGIIAIFASTYFIAPEFRTIGSFTEDDSGKRVIVNATVARKSVSEGNLFLDLNDGTGNITAVMFERTARGTNSYDVKPSQNISAIGQISIYKGELEIIAESIQWT